MSLFVLVHLSWVCCAMRYAEETELRQSYLGLRKNKYRYRGTLTDTPGTVPNEDREGWIMNEKSCTYWIKLYWLGAMTQMLVICVALFSLRLIKIAYPPFLNLVFLAIVVVRKQEMKEQHRKKIVIALNWLDNNSICAYNIVKDILVKYS